MLKASNTVSPTDAEAGMVTLGLLVVKDADADPTYWMLAVSGRSSTTDLLGDRVAQSAVVGHGQGDVVGSCRAEGCAGLAAVEEPPSPNVHALDAMVPSESVEALELNTAVQVVAGRVESGDGRLVLRRLRKSRRQARSTTSWPMTTAHPCWRRCCRRRPAPWRRSRPAGCRFGRWRCRIRRPGWSLPWSSRPWCVLDLSDQYGDDP